MTNNNQHLKSIRSKILLHFKFNKIDSFKKAQLSEDQSTISSQTTIRKWIQKRKKYLMYGIKGWLDYINSRHDYSSEFPMSPRKFEFVPKIEGNLIWWWKIWLKLREKEGEVTDQCTCYCNYRGNALSTDAVTGGDAIGSGTRINSSQFGFGWTMEVVSIRTFGAVCGELFRVWFIFFLTGVWFIFGI